MCVCVCVCVLRVNTPAQRFQLSSQAAGAASLLPRVCQSASKAQRKIKRWGRGPFPSLLPPSPHTLIKGCLLPCLRVKKLATHGLHLPSFVMEISYPSETHFEQKQLIFYRTFMYPPPPPTKTLNSKRLGCLLPPVRTAQLEYGQPVVPFSDPQGAQPSVPVAGSGSPLWVPVPQREALL